MCNGKGKIINYDSKEYKKKCRGVRDQLSKRQIKYRIYNTENNGVRITVCVGKLPTGKCVRGISMCSSEDNFCRAVGQYYAMIRMVKAAAHNINCDPVERQEVFDRQMDGIPVYKGYFNVALTRKEEEMFE